MQDILFQTSKLIGHVSCVHRKWHFFAPIKQSYLCRMDSKYFRLYEIKKLRTQQILILPRYMYLKFEQCSNLFIIQVLQVGQDTFCPPPVCSVKTMRLVFISTTLKLKSTPCRITNCEPGHLSREFCECERYFNHDFKNHQCSCSLLHVWVTMVTC